MSDQFDPAGEHSTDQENKLEVPKLYRVVIHNDDYTPMDFVVEVLMGIFYKDEISAMQIMLNVHNVGKGICGVFSYEIAETKVSMVHQLASEADFPLKASMEEE